MGRLLNQAGYRVVSGCIECYACMVILESLHLCVKRDKQVAENTESDESVEAHGFVEYG